uniref:tRNA-splicing endonuclease subunit Sen54 N-terminal domain-containing protein n=1 Tax=Kalanchoe fedtschenkoi TaxID=63787 RepID=A0A7N0U4C7_KALFE
MACTPVLNHQSDDVSDAMRQVRKDEECAASADDGAGKGGVFSSCAQVWENHSDEDFDNGANDAGDDDDEEGLYDSSLTSKLQFRNDLWRARWDEDMSMAEVLKNKGKMAITTGVIRQGKLFCSMEETLEIGALSLLAPDDEAPLKEMYKRISDKTSDCNWELFEAYRHLKSLGYIVGRHGVPWTSKTKKNLNLSEAATTENKCFHGLEQDLSALSLEDNAYSDKLKPDFDVYLPNSKFKKSSPGDPSFKLYVCRGHPPPKHDIEILESKCGDIPLKICHVDHGRVSYLSFDKAQLPVLP